MKIIRIYLLRVFAVLLIIFGVWGFALVSFNRDAFAQQKPIIIKFAHQLPENHPTSMQARFFEKCVKEKSKGNVIVEVYPSAQLFGARELLPAVRRGAVEIVAVVSSPMVGLVPLMEFWDLPFVVKDWDQVVKIENGYPSEIIRNEFEKVGVHYLAKGYFGFTSICNSKREIKKPKDIEGLKIRTVGPLGAEMIRAMGGAAVVMGGEETYLALARKTVDGSLNGISAMVIRKYWEVQKYVTMLNIYYSPIPMLINSQFWKNLPKEVQSLLQECADKSDEFVLKEAVQYENDAWGIAKKNGMVVYTPTSEEIKEFRKATEHLREPWIKQHGEIASKMVKWIEDLK